MFPAPGSSSIAASPASGSATTNKKPEQQPVTEEEKGLANQGMIEFEKGNFDASISALNKLLKTRPQDPKVLLNKEVALYFKSGLRKTDEFVTALGKVCEMMNTTLEKPDTVEFADQTVPHYNHCVIMYRLQQHRKAITILEKLLQFLDPYEDKLGQKVMCLLIEQFLCIQQPQRAMHYIGMMERSMQSTGSARGAGDSNGASSKEPAAPDSMLEAVKTKLSQFKVRCYVMMGSTKFTKKETKVLNSALGNSASMLYIRAGQEHARGKQRKAVRILNTNPQQARRTHETGEHVPTMYYNDLGVIHFHMRKHNLGAFYFRKALQENTQIVNEFHRNDVSRTLSGRQLPTLSVNRHHSLLYNMGVQLLHCSHPSAAFDCLIETVQLYSVNPRLWLRLAECCIMASRVSNEEDQKLQTRLRVLHTTVGSGLHKKLVFGTGIKDERRSTESAAIPNTTLEFACLCLRNAQYLLPTKEKIADISQDIDPNSRNVNDFTVPAPPSNPLNVSEIENLRSSVYAASAYVALCLSDFHMALKYAKSLLGQPRLSGAMRYTAQMYMAEAEVGLDKIADAVRNLNPESIQDLSLAVPDPERTDKEEKTSKEDREESPDENELLSSWFLEIGDQGCVMGWYPSDVKTARAIMQFNLSVAHSIRGETDRALANLKQVMEGLEAPYPAQVYFLHIYLDMVEGYRRQLMGYPKAAAGRRQSIDGILKEFFGHLIASRPTA